jgi:hypothetical protein
MALFFECMLQCARKVLDTGADIVREAILQQLYPNPIYGLQLTSSTSKKASWGPVLVTPRIFHLP